VIRLRGVLIWLALFAALSWPVAVSATSPLLEWRGPIYIAAGFAGILGLAVMVLQPLLAAGYLPGLPPQRGRRVHRLVGIALVLLIILHVGGLWITSPPDVIDALTFTSATPFAAWGVIAMWTAFAAAALALSRKKLRLSPRLWRPGHSGLVAITLVCTIVHAVLIEGTMGQVSKILLCALAVLATGRALLDLRAWALLKRRRAI
jgi:predicted ferric reductase